MRLAPKENFRCPFKYQGQYYDSEVELCYNRFRYYHPETGRYISQDPIKLLGGFNVFAYVSDTNAWVDVLGLEGSTYARERFDELTDGVPSNRTKQGKKIIRTDIERLPKEYKGFRKNGFDIAKSTDTSTTLVNKDTGEIITIRKSDSGGYDKYDTITFRFPEENKNNSVFFKQ